MLYQKLQKIFPPQRILRNQPLAVYSTIGIGGPAEYLVEAKTTPELTASVRVATENNFPWYILGNGSNTLISDEGFSGLVIVNKCEQVSILKDLPKPIYTRYAINARLQQPNPEEFFTFSGLDYDENDQPVVCIQLDSGLKLQAAIYKLISKGITGLQWFSGIPGTIGGAIFMNAHGGTKFISDYFLSAVIMGKDGKVREEPWSYFKFGYDFSQLHYTREAIITATFELKRGDTSKAGNVAKEWARRKSLQPQRSLGSTFQNLTYETRDKLNLPTTSAGYIIDKILNLKGIKKKGNAIVSDKSANFIENLGGAKAIDVYEIIQEIKSEAKNKIGIDLIEEIQYLGNFNKSGIKPRN